MASLRRESTTSTSSSRNSIDLHTPSNHPNLIEPRRKHLTQHQRLEANVLLALDYTPKQVAKQMSTGDAKYTERQIRFAGRDGLEGGTK
ncbi:hypothetical protein MMC21_004296 [Puttea exsequens]|nr:hypothetical protein [Puttea exsequens]